MNHEYDQQMSQEGRACDGVPRVLFNIFCPFISGFPRTKKWNTLKRNAMGKNQFLFIVANKMFLMIIDKGRDTIINTNSKENPDEWPQHSAFNDRNQLHVFPPILTKINISVQTQSQLIASKHFRSHYTYIHLYQLTLERLQKSRYFL